MPVYRYREDFGRMGDLESLFTADRETIAEMKEFGELYLGEYLGKHSEVYASLSDETITEVSDDPVIEAFVRKLGGIGPDIVTRFVERDL